MNWRCAAASLLVLLPAVAAAAGDPVARFVTGDGWSLVGDYTPSAKGKPLAILAHGVGAGKGEWKPLVKALKARGYGSLAIDLRGHGDSKLGPDGRRGFESFDATGEWPKAVNDVLAAAGYLEQRGIRERRLVLIGGSIGANLCALALAKLPKARALVLLSPGVDFRGVQLPRFDPARAIVAASPGDQYSYATVEEIKKELPSVTVIPSKSGHGAQMLADPAFIAALLDALDAKTR